jgi:hypothetical protein
LRDARGFTGDDLNAAVQRLVSSLESLEQLSLLGERDGKQALCVGLEFLAGRLVLRSDLRHIPRGA